MAVIGEIIVLIVGALCLLISFMACMFSTANKMDGETVFFFFVGAILIFLAIHYGPITVSVGG